MSHIEKKKLEALYQGILPLDERLELLSHLQACEYCTTEFISHVEDQELLTAPKNLKSLILTESQCLSTQIAVQQKKTSKKLQLLIYSLKISTAVVCTIFLLSVINTYVLASEINATRLPCNSITTTLNQRSNELAADFKNFSNKLINWR